jgi:hypothetical protein
VFFCACATLLGASALDAAPVSAQRMSLALSRLRTSEDGMNFQGDDEAWSRLATQFTGALIPPLIGPARTRGPRSFYLGIETMMTGIDSSAPYWRRGTEGDTGTVDENRAVDSLLTWTRLSLRKALPFGFELGTSAGHLINTNYFTLGLEIRWALFEGWTGRDAWIPDFAVRGAVQTLVGDAQFNTTIATIDATLSNSVVLGDAFELSPYIGGQINWVFADTELIDLTPERNAIRECDPDPENPTPLRPVCRGDGTDIGNSTVFRSIRTMRPRLVLGAQGRYEVITVNAAFSFDLLSPSEADSSLPTDLARQWRLDLGAGLSF